MTSRYDLNPRLAKLQAVLAKAERTLPLDQPLRSADLYAQALHTVDQLIERLEAAVAEARRPR